MDKFKAVEELILDLNFEEAFKILKSIVPNEDEDIRNSLFLIETRYILLKRDHDIRNLILRSEAGIEWNRIVYSLKQIKDVVAKKYEKYSSNFEKQDCENNNLSNNSESQYKIKHKGKGNIHIGNKNTTTINNFK